MPLPPEARALLAPFVTSLDSPVFCLKNLPEEVVAVLFAYYSRSQDDLRANLLKLIQDRDVDLTGTPVSGDEAGSEELALARRKAREFHEKWVVGYGHASVAEHAVAHIAIEDVSILASKVIEDARLASYTEKSTRYVPFPRAYYRLPELHDAAGAHAALEHLFDVYERLLGPVTDAVARIADRSAFRTERGFRNSCQARACDALRYLLPAATTTNIGMTANARTLEHLVSKMVSHPLQEIRETGDRIRAEVTKVIPTLIKYARPSDYMRETPPALRALAAEFLGEPGDSGLVPGRQQNGPEAQAGSDAPDNAVRLVSAPPDPEAALAAAILYEFCGLPYIEVQRRVAALGRAEQERVIEEYLRRRRTYGDPVHGYTDPPLRSLEHLVFSFDILVDYGAFRDIQRHRMATQTTQRLTCDAGFDTPELLTQLGFASAFDAAMRRAADAWCELAARHPEEAQYVVPLAYRKRVLFTWNLRSLHHFISLRSARQGHVSYRRIAQEVYRELARTHPFLAKFIRVDLQTDYEMARPG